MNEGPVETESSSSSNRPASTSGHSLKGHHIYIYIPLASFCALFSLSSLRCSSSVDRLYNNIRNEDCFVGQPFITSSSVGKNTSRTLPLSLLCLEWNRFHIAYCSWEMIIVDEFHHVHIELLESTSTRQGEERISSEAINLIFVWCFKVILITFILKNG